MQALDPFCAVSKQQVSQVYQDHGQVTYLGTVTDALRTVTAEIENQSILGVCLWS
jgi:hypothetical protein